MKYIITFLVLILTPNISYAYLDPGTGAGIIQVLIAFISTIIFYLIYPFVFVKNFFKKFKKKIFKKKRNANTKL